MRKNKNLSFRLVAQVPNALACGLIVLASMAATGRHWLPQEPSQQPTQQPSQQPTTDATQAQQPSQAPATTDQSAAPAATPDGQTPAAAADGSAPAAAADGQAPQPAAADGTVAAAPDGQAPAAAADAAGQTPTVAAAGDKKGDKGDKKKGKKEKETGILKTVIDPLAGIKDLDGDSFKEAGPFTEPDSDVKDKKHRRTTGISEDELKSLLLKKQLYIRGGYLNDTLNFNEHGGLVGKSPTGSYTLNSVEITHINMTKHKIILTGDRYGMHFMGNVGDDSDKNIQLIKLTPPKKKKELVITIDREVVVKAPKAKVLKTVVPIDQLPKKVDKKSKGKDAEKRPAEGTSAEKPADGSAPSEGAVAADGQKPAEGAAPVDGAAANAQKPADGAAADPNAKPATGDGRPIGADGKPLTDEQLANMTPEEQAKAEMAGSIAAAKPEERPADPNSLTHTYSAIHASRVLRQALDKIFSVDMDSRMMDAMPPLWKHYYDAQATKGFYRFKDPSLVKLSEVEVRPSLTKGIDPGSNSYAQENGITGIARYRAYVGADGKAKEVAITVPIGFGLDERAEASILSTDFKPAMKGGQPVATAIDLYITFRIFSKLTSPQLVKKDADAGDNNVKVAPPARPGPYTLVHPYKNAPNAVGDVTTDATGTGDQAAPATTPAATPETTPVATPDTTTAPATSPATTTAEAPKN